MLTLLNKLATDYSNSYNYNLPHTSHSQAIANIGVAGTFLIIFVAFLIFAIIVNWRVYKKAGRPGWASIVPIYNAWVFFEMAGMAGWLALLFLIPFVNLIMLIPYAIACVKVAKRFGKSGVWGFFLLFLLPIIGFIILAFDKSTYQVDDGTPGSGQVPPQPSATVNPTPPVQPAI